MSTTKLELSKVLLVEIVEPPTMSENESEKQSLKIGDASFGSGLGPDFEPLGRRIIIGPARNHRKLVVRTGSHKVREATTYEGGTD
ncbi:hypothetical protein [Rhizobium sp. LCM 4573]|uniref:hypothetical protein n=1 Tax=Rhizobium sp. LCM 4573 TaxID=1848291 RepID=UPI001FCDB354|nr:hypothetical protein [Rhizobium sp. LCM 4573]